MKSNNFDLNIGQEEERKIDAGPPLPMETKGEINDGEELDIDEDFKLPIVTAPMNSNFEKLRNNVTTTTVISLFPKITEILFPPSEKFQLAPDNDGKLNMRVVSDIALESKIFSHAKQRVRLRLAGREVSPDV